MAYMLLIVEPQGQRRTRPQQEGHDLYQRMVDYGRSLTARGLLGGALRPWRRDDEKQCAHDRSLR